MRASRQKYSAKRFLLSKNLLLLDKDHCLLFRQQRETLRQTDLAKERSAVRREFSSGCTRLPLLVDVRYAHCRTADCPAGYTPFARLCVCRSGICTDTDTDSGRECGQTAVLLEHQGSPQLFTTASPEPTSQTLTGTPKLTGALSRARGVFITPTARPAMEMP